MLATKRGRAVMAGQMEDMARVGGAVSLTLATHETCVSEKVTGAEQLVGRKTTIST